MGILSEGAVEGFARELCNELKGRIEKQRSSPQAVSVLKEFGMLIIKSSCYMRVDARDDQYPAWVWEYLKLFRG